MCTERDSGSPFLDVVIDKERTSDMTIEAGLCTPSPEFLAHTNLMI